jgi:GTP-binding protein HflX
MRVCGGSRPGGSNEQAPAPNVSARGEKTINRHRFHDTLPRPERAYLVAVESQARGALNAQDSLDELAQLTDTAGAEVVGSTSQRLEAPHPRTYVGKGKLAEIVSERAAQPFDTLILDDELSPSQQRHLEDATEAKVIDRTALILDIFARRAQTREGRLQVELAQLEYLLPRLAGQWSHLERLGGGIGTRGPGETQLETDRRLLRSRIGILKRQLEEVRRHRSLYRRNRVRQGLAVVALVGYTNAGKSSLMNALSGAGVPAEDRPFETLDPVTRRIRLAPERPVLLTDTVGFIQKLPTQLVAAFRATLEELEDADVLIHVIDVTHPNAEHQRETVEATLGSLGLEHQPRLELLNKVDLLTKPDGAPVSGLSELSELQQTIESEQNAPLLISAVRGWGLDEVRRRLIQMLDSREPGSGLSSSRDQ